MLHLTSRVSKSATISLKVVRCSSKDIPYSILCEYNRYFKCNLLVKPFVMHNFSNFSHNATAVFVDRTKTHIQIYTTLSPKDYCLIPGNFAIKFVETQKSPIINHFQIWFWQDTLQVHRAASNKMDISPDIDPTEISEF